MVANGVWRGVVLRVLALAVGVAVMGVLAAGLSTPAHAQSDEGGDGGGGWGQRLCDGASLIPAPGTGLICDTGRGAVDRVAGGEEDGGGDGGGSPEEDGSSSGSSEDGSGSGGGSNDAPTGTGNEGQGEAGGEQGRYGVWTTPINLLQGLMFIAAGIGIGGGILVKATAGGNRDRHELSIHMFEGSLAGFLLGTIAIQFYKFISDLVVGF